MAKNKKDLSLMLRPFGVRHGTNFEPVCVRFEAYSEFLIYFAIE
jgi:hypothetical protein